jgi:hypothetical protein
MGKRSVNKNSKKRSVRDPKSEAQKAIKGGKHVRPIATFVIGTLFGLYVVSWFVAILPGPKVMATVHGLRGTTPNTTGCVYYTFVISCDQPIEYTYLKLQFPGKINNFRVGLPQEAQTATAGKVAMQVWEAGKDASGACTIVQAAINNSADVQASAAGNMIAIHASKLPLRTNVMGMIATTEGESSVKPISVGVYTEGAYEYLKLGQTVRKTLSVSNTGITDAK